MSGGPARVTAPHTSVTLNPMALWLSKAQYSPPCEHTATLSPGTELNDEITVAQHLGTAHGPLAVQQEQHFTGHSKQGQTSVAKGMRTRF